MNGLDETGANEDNKAFDEGIESTKALIQTFLQTVKAYQLYEVNHPILPKFIDRLKQDVPIWKHPVYAEGSEPA